MNIRYYTLDKVGLLHDSAPVLEPDVIRWSQWFDHADRTVFAKIIHGVKVEIVFLGVGTAENPDEDELYEVFVTGKDDWETQHGETLPIHDGAKFQTRAAAIGDAKRVAGAISLKAAQVALLDRIEKAKSATGKTDPIEESSEGSDFMKAIEEIQ